MPALGTTTSIRQTGRVFPAKAFQVSDNLIFSVGPLTSRGKRQSLRLCQERCVEIHHIVAQALHEEENESNS
jgi:hypothetical protein